MKIKVSEATNIQIDWMVAKCEGKPRSYLVGENFEDMHGDGQTKLHWSTNWEQAGLIIDREDIDIINKKYLGEPEKNYMAYYWDDELMNSVFGPTRLIAAMRMYVLYKLGEFVEVPDNLL